MAIPSLIPRMLWAGLMLIGISGCGGEGVVREYGTLSGAVFLNGKPVPAGTMISLVNPTNGAATSAQVRDGGEYRFSRAQVGTYNVGVMSQSQKSAVATTDPDALMQSIAQGSYQETKTDSQIPAKYQTPESSGLTVEVKLGENLRDFEL